MIEGITKCMQTTDTDYKFSLLVPTWNNLDLLKLCVRSIRQNSFHKIQLIVVVNEGKDGTLEWVKTQPDLDYVHAVKNIGICYGLNSTRSLIKAEYIVYLNDDMYVLPNWDLELSNEIEKIGSKAFMVSGTLIEPTDTGNPCVVVKDYGRNVEDFKEALLLKEYKNMAVTDWSGSTWPPNVMHIDMWDLVGGYSIEFSPGMYSDPDLSRKLFEAGVRTFIGKGSSLVYHFGSKSTKRIKRNNGRKTFILKWGITSKTFTKQFLKLGKSANSTIEKPELSFFSKLINKLKRIKSC